jgi:integrase/recombinase XerD
MTARQPTPLRQRMLDDMRLRNMADGTCRSYVRSVADFSAFHGRSPDELTLEDVRDYQLHLVARGLKASTICQITSALRFLYAVTLDRPEQAARIPLPRKADPLPAILSTDEVAHLLGAVPVHSFETPIRTYATMGNRPI